ncbi:hypothetical protein ABT297_02795 [Dactylosporangium sp. NPDC000555]|uniref:hypothetical protein n=1 Tax=Dactylosporangium sp. NPDC000555 TaxID=3154260 RepID=UPI0033191E74
MKTRAWQCVAGAALMVGTLSAAQAAREPDPPPMVERSNATTIHPDGTAVTRPDNRVVHVLTGSGLLAFAGVVLVGGVVGLGGMRVPGGVSMGVARSRLWYRSVRRTGVHRASGYAESR